MTLWNSTSEPSLLNSAEKKSGPNHVEEFVVEVSKGCCESEPDLDTKSFFPSWNKVQHMMEFVEGGVLIFVWYLCSLFSSNLSKTILEDHVFPHPFSLTLFQFFFVSVCCLVLLKASSSYKLQRLDWNLVILILLPLCVSQIIAHLLSQISFQHVPVSFTHTVKATSPIFAILLSLYYKFNEKYSFQLLFSIVPIILGVVLSSLMEVNFDFIGFITALGSTIVFSWQNAFSKKVFRSKELDEINLLFWTSLAAFVVMFPPWVMFDLFDIVAEYQVSQRSDMIGYTASLITLNGLCHFGQNIAAFTLMTRVTPLTYTIFNTSKRLFVIVFSILYFANSVPILNAVGIAMAISGVVLYNKAKLDILSSESKQTRSCSN